MIFGFQINESCAVVDDRTAKINHWRICSSGSCKSGKSSYDSLNNRKSILSVLRVWCTLRSLASHYLVMFQSESQLHCWIQGLLGFLKPELVTKLTIKTCELPTAEIVDLWVVF
ncbi:hypothetical protein LINPERHAP1_LOCUS30320 [Linum perenne]